MAPVEDAAITEAERAEWRAKGFEAGEVHADALAALVQGGVADGDVQNQVASIGASLQGEAQKLRDAAIPEALVEVFTQSVVERVMLRMHALRSAAEAS